MLTIQLLRTEIGLKFESSSQKLFDFNRLKIVMSMGVYTFYINYFNSFMNNDDVNDIDLSENEY